MLYQNVYFAIMFLFLLISCCIMYITNIKFMLVFFSSTVIFRPLRVSNMETVIHLTAETYLNVKRYLASDLILVSIHRLHWNGMYTNDWRVHFFLNQVTINCIWVTKCHDIARPFATTNLSQIVIALEKSMYYQDTRLFVATQWPNSRCPVISKIYELWSYV